MYYLPSSGPARPHTASAAARAAIVAPAKSPPSVHTTTSTTRGSHVAFTCLRSLETRALRLLETPWRRRVQPARSCAARVAQNEIFWRTLGQRQCPQSARHAAGVGWREREARRPVRGVRCPPRASHACRARPALASLLRQHVGASGWDDSIPSSLPHSIGCARRANGSCQRLNERPDEVATGAQGSWVVRSCPSWRPTSRRPALATHLQTLSDGPGRAASRRPSTTFTT